MDYPDLTLIMFIAIASGIIVSIIMYEYFKFYGWSAITMAIIVAYLVININYPIGHLMNEKESYVIALYLLIEVFVPIYLFSALIIMLFLHARKEECGCISP
jgi:hypothetical protein